MMLPDFLLLLRDKVAKGMIAYISARLITALFVVLGVITAVFFIIHLIPGDPVELMLGETAPMADREQLRQALGLHQPLVVQWWQYLAGVLQLDFGQSLHSRVPITEILAPRLLPTVQLGLLSLFVAIVLALPLGVVSAMRKNTAVDHGAMVVALLGVSIPNFLLGPLLILVFSLSLGWFPVSGDSEPLSIVLPALTLGSALAAVLSRMIRASLLEALNEPYIVTARAKGLSWLVVVWRHALRNSLLPIVTLMGLQLGALLAGAVITEVVFSWPGLGQLTIDAIQKRDYPLVQACVLIISVTYVVVNTLTDIVYGIVDPRVRLMSA